jgi:uncharacterized protein (DUF983 family)
MTFAQTAHVEPTPVRAWWPAMKLGFHGICPACGEGKIFRAFLKVNDCCPCCGEELHHHRADDAPPYFTILVVAHIVGAAMLFVEQHNDTLDIWIHILLWPSVTPALTFWLLPKFKGALVAYQWALRMHGFETVPPKTAHAARAP